MLVVRKENGVKLVSRRSITITFVVKTFRSGIVLFNNFGQRLLTLWQLDEKNGGDNNKQDNKYGRQLQKYIPLIAKIKTTINIAVNRKTSSVKTN